MFNLFFKLLAFKCLLQSLLVPGNLLLGSQSSLSSSSSLGQSWNTMDKISYMKYDLAHPKNTLFLPKQKCLSSHCSATQKKWNESSNSSKIKASIKSFYLRHPSFESVGYFLKSHFKHFCSGEKFFACCFCRDKKCDLGKYPTNSNERGLK